MAYHAQRKCNLCGWNLEHYLYIYPAYLIFYILFHLFILSGVIFIRPSLRRDVLWYTNVRPSVSHVTLSLKNPLANSLQISQSYWNWWSYGLYTLWWNFEFSFQSYGTLFIKLYVILSQFFMSCCKLRIPLPIHFKLRIVIGIDSRILFGEISIFHSRVMGLQLL